MRGLAAVAEPVIALLAVDHMTQQGATTLGAEIDVGQRRAPCAQTIALCLGKSIGAMLVT